VSIDCGRSASESQFDPVLIEIGSLPQLQPIEAEFSGKVLLRERRALIGKTLFTHQGDRVGIAAAAQGIDQLGSGLSCPDNHHTHGGRE
jgi:hypothetical protein